MIGGNFYFRWQVLFPSCFNIFSIFSTGQLWKSPATLGSDWQIRTACRICQSGRSGGMDYGRKARPAKNPLPRSVRIGKSEPPAGFVNPAEQILRTGLQTPSGKRTRPAKFRRAHSSRRTIGKSELPAGFVNPAGAREAGAGKQKRGKRIRISPVSSLRLIFFHRVFQQRHRFSPETGKIRTRSHPRVRQM